MTIIEFGRGKGDRDKKKRKTKGKGNLIAIGAGATVGLATIGGGALYLNKRKLSGIVNGKPKEILKDAAEALPGNPVGEAKQIIGGAKPTLESLSVTAKKATNKGGILGSISNNKPTVKTSTNAIMTSEVSGVKDANTFAKSYIVNTKRTVNETADAIKSGYMSGGLSAKGKSNAGKAARGAAKLFVAAKRKAAKDINTTAAFIRKQNGG
jgi:hypothetical protein